MIEGAVVTILTLVIVVWVGFSMAGRDEARVSASTDLSKWYTKRSIATIDGMEEVLIERDYISLVGRGVQEQRGYKLDLLYEDRLRYTKRTYHYFYDESKQDEEFLERYIEGDEISVWIAQDGQVYVPGEVIENRRLQTIYGADRVLMYSFVVAVIAWFISTLFIILISPLWVFFHTPLVIIASIVPQLYMYMSTASSEVQRLYFKGVSALNQYGLFIDDTEEGVKKYKLVEQTLPMVMLENGVGYLGYKPEKVDVFVDYEGNIPIHIASEYRISELIKAIYVKVTGKEIKEGE